MQKTALITGANGVIGKAISEVLAEKEWSLILLGRDRESIGRVCSEIKKLTGKHRIKPAIVDLSRESDIRKFANELEGSIDILINNAGTTPPARLETPEGIEMQWATNVLGYMWMTEYLRPKMNAGGRIVNVVSFYAGGLDMSDVEFKRRRYNNDSAYRQSKQANRMLSAHFSALYQPFDITVNSCHPGEITSKLSTNLGFSFPDPPRIGADTPVWVATEMALQKVTGRYFQYRKDLPCRFSQNPTENQALYDLCKTYYGRS